MRHFIRGGEGQKNPAEGRSAAVAGGELEEAQSESRRDPERRKEGAPPVYIGGGDKVCDGKESPGNAPHHGE